MKRKGKRGELCGMLSKMHEALEEENRCSALPRYWAVNNNGGDSCAKLSGNQELEPMKQQQQQQQVTSYKKYALKTYEEVDDMNEFRVQESRNRSRIRKPR